MGIIPNETSSRFLFHRDIYERVVLDVLNDNVPLSFNVLSQMSY